MQQPQSTHRALAEPSSRAVIKPHSSTTLFFFQNPLKQKSPHQTKSLFKRQQNWLGKWKQCRDHRTQLLSLFLCPLWSSWERRVREGEGGKACSHPPGIHPTAIFPSLWALLQHYWHLAFCLEQVCWLAAILSWKAGGRISLSGSGMSWLHWVHLLTTFDFPYECTAEYLGSYFTAVTSGIGKHFWATSISY